MRPVVIGGTPGSGKSTLCSSLSKLERKGVHLRTDEFFDFLAHRIDPSKPDSRSQNETVVRAYCAAARAYADGGYSVFVDGVIGPWLHSEIASVLGAFDYVLLHASLAETLSRMAKRPGQISARPSVAERMHHQFEAALEDCPGNVVRSDRYTPAELVDVVRARLQSGACTVGEA